LTLGGTLSLTSGQVTTALGFTPYNATNPAGYITSAALSGYLPLTGGTLASSGSSNTLNINHTSGSGIALNILKNGNGEGLTIVKGSGSGNAASITGGITLLSELNLTTKLADAHIASAATWNAKIGGSGTTNYLAKFTASGVVGNSLIFDNGTNVGIGITSPQSRLHISLNNAVAPTSGTTPKGIGMSFGGFDGNNLGLWFSSDFGADQGIAGIASTRVSEYSTDLRFYTNNTNSARAFSERMRITPGGNLLIGTTTDAGFKLDVNGSFRATGAATFSDLSASGNVIVSANNSGTLGKVTIGSGLSLSGGVLTATGGSAGTVTGSGTAGRLAVWNSASDIGATTALTIAGSNLQVTGSVTASSFIRSGGTSSQFLKADGSVDSSAYITGLSWAALTGKPTTISGFGITDAVSNVQGVQGAWTGTQAAYDAIATKSSTTIYFIQ
jgi:hypothetical protein